MEPQRAPIVVVALRRTVVGFDAFTGRRVWEQTVNPSTPRLWTIGELVYVLAGAVFCFRIATGELVWKSQEISGDTFLVAHGVIMVGTIDGTVTAFAAGDGRVLWHDGLKGMGAQSIAFAMEGGPVAQIDGTR